MGAGVCLSAAAITTISSAILGGLGAYGTSQGWEVEGDGGKVGDARRSVSYQPFHNVHFGTLHYYDAEKHSELNDMYGDMLESHNTTLVSVTWTALHPDANHTTSALNGLDMTYGRVLTLNDNGAIRTSISHIDHLGGVLESFNKFKGNYSDGPLGLGTRSTDVKYVTYNTYGENMRNANQGYGSDSNAAYYFKHVDLTEVEESQYYSEDNVWAEQGTGGYPLKYCMGASRAGNTVGENSIIVGEVYYNQWGGIDSECKSG